MQEERLDNMKNILFLVDRYYPRPSVNGICCENVINKLRERGHNVFVGAYQQTDNIEEKKYSFPIGRLYSQDYHISFFRKLKHYIGWITPFKKLPAVLDKKMAGHIRDAATYIIKEERIDTVVCAFFPMEILVSGTMLKKIFPEITFIAYLLDPFYGGFVPRFIPSKMANNKNKKWQLRVLEQYDMSILMS